MNVARTVGLSSLAARLKLVSGGMIRFAARLARGVRSIPFSALVFLALLVVGIAVAVWTHHNAEVRRTFEDRQSELGAIADLKVKQLLRWRIERQGDGLVLSENRAVARQFERCLADSSLFQGFVPWLNLMSMHSDYSRIQLLDTTMRVRFASNDAARVLESHDVAFAGEVLREKKVLLTDLYLSEPDNRPTMDLIVPIILSELKGSPVVGVFLFHIDPNTYLYPLVESWPTSSRSSESMLIRRDADSVVFLNDLRNRSNAALRLRLPVANKSTPASLAARGDEGKCEGVDYRNAEVLAFIKKIPDSPWSLVAKIDREEVESGIAEETRADLLAGILLVVATAFAVGLWWRHERAEFYRARLKAEEERRALIQHFEYLVRYANDIIILADKQLRIVEMNERGFELYGYKKSEIIGRRVGDLEADEGKETFAERLKVLNLYRGGRYESLQRRKDGSTFPAEFSTRIIELEGSLYYQMIARDITERKRSEEALREKEFWIKESQRVGRIGSYILDFQTRTWTSSAVLDEIFGICGEFDRSVVGWLGLIHPEQKNDMMTYFSNDVIAQGHPFNKEYRVVRANDGVVRWVWGLGELSYDSSGALRRMIGTIQDITERKNADNEIRRLNAELELRVRDRTAQLETANRELESFSYSVSHDLRAPLRGIDGWSLALVEDYRDSLDSRAHEYIGRIRAEAQRMGTLIDDLLQLARVTRAGLELDRMNISDLVRVIASRLKEHLPYRSIEFSVEEGLHATADPRLMEIALTNLLDNACKFTSTREKAMIEFGRNKDGTAPVYFLRDNGVGFDPAYSTKLFGPFQRMHKTSEFPGTGIGLATVQRIVHRHGGRVWADARVGEGATFYFTLPEAR